MSKTLERLARLKKWQLDAISKQLGALNAEQNQLKGLQQALEGYLQRESALYDQAVENHSILPQFMKNITLRQRKVAERMKAVEVEKETCVEHVKEVLQEKKQVELLKAKIEEAEQKELEKQEQSMFDELSLAYRLREALAQQAKTPETKEKTS